jgi:hypothetical protein
MRSLMSILGGFPSCRNHPQILCATLWMEPATQRRTSGKALATKSIQILWKIRPSQLQRHTNRQGLICGCHCGSISQTRIFEGSWLQIADAHRTNLLPLPKHLLKSFSGFMAYIVNFERLSVMQSTRWPTPLTILLLQILGGKVRFPLHFCRSALIAKTDGSLP